MMRKLTGLLFVLALSASPAFGQEAVVPVKAESPAKAGAPAAKPVTLTVTYTDQEAAVLLRLLDMAVRQGGLDAAGNAAYLAAKIKDAAKAAGIAQTATPPPPKKE